MRRLGRRTAATPSPLTGTWSAQRSRTTATAWAWPAAQASSSPSTKALLPGSGAAGCVCWALLSWGVAFLTAACPALGCITVQRSAQTWGTAPACAGSQGETLW